MKASIENRCQAAFELAVSHHQAGRLAEAEAGYREILEAEPGHAGALHLLGMIGHQTGNPDLAVRLIGEAVAIAPDYAEAYNNLGNALKDLGRLDEAVASYRRAIAIVPDYAKAHNNLGSALADRGETRDAIACYRKAIELAPDDAVAHYNLGNALRDTDRPAEATACYRRAIEADPGLADAQLRRGRMLQGQGKLDDAIACYRRTIDLAPDCADAHYELSAVLNTIGQLVEAHRLLEEGRRLRPITTAACTAGKPAATILKLIGRTLLSLKDGRPTIIGGNLNTTTLIDRAKFTVHEFFVHDNNLLDMTASLPPYDIVLNGIVDPDVEMESLNTAQAFIASQDAPYINDPAKVRLTTRDSISQRLTGIDNLVVPKVVRETLAANDPSLFMPVVEKQGLRFPLIVRFAGGHVGAGMTKVDREEDFTRVPFMADNLDFYFTEFHDYQNKNGLYYKYRSYFLDGIHFPAHVVIFNHWKVHADAARNFMKAHDWMTKFEEDLLENYIGHLSQKNLDTLTEIDRRVGLDFFGIDFSVLSDGRLLLFECNPAMRCGGSWTEQFAYRNKYEHRIPDAFSEFVLARIRR